MKRLVLLLSAVALLSACKKAESTQPEHRLMKEAKAFLEQRPKPTGRVVEIDLVAAPTTLELLDGRALDVWAYNGQVPGPTLRVRVGDTLRVNFTNDLPQSTTVHWHGIRLPNGMDGVPGVTQPPIPPGGTFLYEFQARDAGTFWFHPHLFGSEQLERGLYGLLIIEEAEPTGERELLWVLDDWRLDDSGQIDPRFVTRGDLSHDGRWGSRITVNGQERPEFELAAGETVRLRILNAANGRVFAPDFSALDAQIIAFDGLSTARPLSTEGLVLAPGNRVDLELTAPADEGRIARVMDRYTRRPFQLATLSTTVAASEPTPRPSRTQGFVPRWEGAEQLPPDLVFRLNAARGGPYGLQWMINEHAMIHEEGEMSESHAAHYRLPRGKWAKMRFTNESSRLHPMHLHGQFFKVVARNGQPVNEEHWRDTVLVGPRETVDVGLVPTEPGTWMLHCHIMEHHEAGMMTLIAVDDGATNGK